jgi:hypothetical protein
MTQAWHRAGLATETARNRGICRVFPRQSPLVKPEMGSREVVRL